MPTKKPMRGPAPSPDLVLAAIDRATRHRHRSETPGVLLATVKEHLGLARHGGDTRRLRPTWDALFSARLIECSRHHGLTLWRLTSKGRRRLAAAQRGGNLESLPESPQHRAWRDAQTAAAEHVEEFQQDMRDALTAALQLLDDAGAKSDSWMDAIKRLRHAGCRLASVMYCLSEWGEPDEARADVAPEPYRGLRTYRRWDRD